MIVDGTRAPYRAVRVGQDVFVLVLALDLRREAGPAPAPGTAPGLSARPI